MYFAVAIACSLLVSLAGAQDKGKDLAVIRGKIAYDKNLVESWDGKKLVIPYGEIKASLRERVLIPDPKQLPAKFRTWKGEDQIKWETEFFKTAEGKAYLENRKKLIENAFAVDVKFEKDGTFVVYDVPTNKTYGLQGRTDKELSGTNYGFEVFAEISVVKDVREIVLPPMRVEVTPLYRSGQPAPPINVQTPDGKNTLSLDHKAFKGKFVFLNYWSTASPTSAAEQKMVQEMYRELKEKHKLKLISVNIDQDQAKSMKFIVNNKMEEGSHGFTRGVTHRTLYDYGVRSFPSFWLIDPDGKIKMTQFDVARMMRLKPDLKTIVDDSVMGKELPTPAKKPEEKPEEKKDATKETSSEK